MTNSRLTKVRTKIPRSESEKAGRSPNAKDSSIYNQEVVTVQGMLIQKERTKVAIEYFRALRVETVERLKMRDRILFGYLGASAALIGYGQEHLDFTAPLALLVPFLALGAATSIAQHQDQIVAFNEYLTLELIEDLPNKVHPVLNFNASKAGISHLSHNLSANVIAQLLLLCGPPIFALINGYPYSILSPQSKEIYAVLGSILTLLTAGRIWFSRTFRNRVMSKLDARLNQAERIAVAAAAQSPEGKKPAAGPPTHPPSSSSAATAP